MKNKKYQKKNMISIGLPAPLIVTDEQPARLPDAGLIELTADVTVN